MNTQPAICFRGVLTFLVGEMAMAVSRRGGETKQRQFAGSQTAAIVLDLRPCDIVDTMLAGHAVMFHAVTSDRAHDTLRGDADAMRHGMRSNAVALNKAFIGNVDMTLRGRARQSTPLCEGTWGQPR